MRNKDQALWPSGNLSLGLGRTSLYRCRGYERARRAFIGLVDRMALSQLPEMKKLRTTLMKWKTEILNYFLTGLTNGRTEGFNNLAKLLQKRAFGFRSFKNYRLRLAQVFEIFVI
jgi:transposase